MPCTVKSYMSCACICRNTNTYMHTYIHTYLVQSGLTCLHAACDSSTLEVVKYLAEIGGKELVVKIACENVSINSRIICVCMYMYVYVHTHTHINASEHASPLSFIYAQCVYNIHRYIYIVTERMHLNMPLCYPSYMLCVCMCIIYIRI